MKDEEWQMNLTRGWSAHSELAIRYSLFPHPSPTHRYAMNGAPARYSHIRPPPIATR